MVGNWYEKPQKPKRRRRKIDWGDVFSAIGAVTLILFAVALVGLLVYGIVYEIQNNLDAGTLVDKYHQDAHVSHYTSWIQSGKVRIPVRRTSRHPESWWFVVEAENKRDYWQVSEDFYNSAEVGDYVERR